MFEKKLLSFARSEHFVASTAVFYLYLQKDTRLSESFACKTPFNRYFKNTNIHINVKNIYSVLFYSVSILLNTSCLYILKWHPPVMAITC